LVLKNKNSNKVLILIICTLLFLFSLNTSFSADVEVSMDLIDDTEGKIKDSISKITSREDNINRNGASVKSGDCFLKAKSATQSTINVLNEVKYGDLFLIEGVLTNHKGNPIVDVYGNLEVNGKKYSVKTDSGGKWALTIKAIESGEVKFTFNEDDDCIACENIAIFNVIGEETPAASNDADEEIFSGEEENDDEWVLCRMIGRFEKPTVIKPPEAEGSKEKKAVVVNDNESSVKSVSGIMKNTTVPVIAILLAFLTILATAFYRKN